MTAYFGFCYGFRRRWLDSTKHPPYVRTLHELRKWIGSPVDAGHAVERPTREG
jgi:hypothetical protein